MAKAIPEGANNDANWYDYQETLRNKSESESSSLGLVQNHDVAGHEKEVRTCIETACAS